MSVEAVHARIAEISSRFGALAPAALLAPVQARVAAPAAAAVPVSGSGQSGDFAGQLQKLVAGSTSATAPGAARATAAPGGDVAQRVIASAKEHLGVPYLWGGTTPKGFDCSGLVQYVFGQHGVSLPRVSKDQARAGVAVSAADARPGDLVAFDNSRSRAGIDHIGIYLGNGKWIAAPRTGDVVKIQDVDLSKAVAIRRVLPDSAPSPAAAMASAGWPSAALAGEGSAGAARTAAPGPAAALGAPAWSAAVPAAGQRFVPAFTAASQATGVDARLLASVAWSESGFDPAAVSRAGAQGLMQIMPATARGLGVDATDPQQAALGGARYLAENLQKFDGRVDLALAAYNAGPAAVRKHGGIPPYPETQKYVSTVLDRYRSLGGTL